VPRIAPALLTLCLALLACSPRDMDAGTAAELRDFDQALARLQNGIRVKLAEHAPDPQVFRGRTFRDDMAQWVMAEATRQTIGELRENAVTASRLSAGRSLEVARRMLNREFARSQGVVDYWVRHPTAPQWRRYWNKMFEANQVPPEPPDPQLLAIEVRMSAALEQGEFGLAAREAAAMQTGLGEALNRAAGRLGKSVRAELKFRPRRTPCMPGGTPDPARSGAAITRGEDLDRYYPPDAKRRGEQGSLVLRVRVDEKGCGTQVAVVVRSGSESIDAAALRWFETAKFSAGTRSGRPIVSDLVFKIRFRIAG
jgi:TonB family protein